MGKKFYIYCEDISGEGSEFALICKIDGKITDKQCGYYCFEDVLINSYKFFAMVCDKYFPDTRFDELSVNISYTY